MAPGFSRLDLVLTSGSVRASMPLALAQEQVEAPTIHPGNVATSGETPVEITITCPTQSAEIRYTLDGSEPNAQSTLYRAPLSVRAPAQLIARGFVSGWVPSESRSAHVYDPRRNGLRYKYYEGEWQALPDFDSLTPKATGSAPGPVLETVKQREDGFGVSFSGYLEIRQDAEYTFYLSSDDGSRLSINGRQVVVNDGQHGVVEKQGSVRLGPGRHPLRVDFFDSRMGDFLKLEYSAPGMPRKVAPVQALLLEAQ
jgi:hypothetical protein